MSECTTVSNEVMLDLLSAKSKINDVMIYVFQHEEQLRSINALNPLLAILDGAYYGGMRVIGDEYE